MLLMQFDSVVDSRATGPRQRAAWAGRGVNILRALLLNQSPRVQHTAGVNKQLRAFNRPPRGTDGFSHNQKHFNF